MTTKLPYANKDLGQHFLRDQNVINKICTDFVEQAQAIIEVGPGPGILTKNLHAHKLPFHVIEKDERFPELLQEFMPKENILLHDALTVDLNSFIEERSMNDKDIWLVSNLPYNVGVPLMINFIKCEKIKYMTLMFQKEVADKVVPFMTREGKAMGSLMALTQNFFDVKLLCKVPPGAFQPPPKVDSAVISLTRKENPEIPMSEFDKYEKYLRGVFLHKRKQLGKVLKANFSSDKVEAAFTTLGIDKTVRAEALGLNQIQALYKELK